MSAFTTPSYDVQRPTGVCAMTGKSIEPGESFYAALVEMTDQEIAEFRQQLAEARAKQEKKQGTKQDKKKAGSDALGTMAMLGLKRVDVCLDAWQAQQRPEQVFSYWKTTQPEPGGKPNVFVDDAVLMELLKRLEDATEPDRLAFRHVLALILLRKKLLRYDEALEREATVGEQTGRYTFWRLTPKLDVAKGPLGKWSDTSLMVLDPGMDEQQVQQVVEQLGEILSAEL